MKSKKIEPVRYNYSNPESQKLFGEFTLLLADITKYVEKEERQIISLEEEVKLLNEQLIQRSRIRYMLKSIFLKLLGNFKRIPFLRKTEK